jgi:hypothetical protein
MANQFTEVEYRGGLYLSVEVVCDRLYTQGVANPFLSGEVIGAAFV